MAQPNKKGLSLSPKQGRPVRGALSSYPVKLRKQIYDLRNNHEGWGAITILLELEERYGYNRSDLPGQSSVARYLKDKGLIKIKEPSGYMPSKSTPRVKQCHDLWEMDAQGAVDVQGIGHVSMINIKDSKSKTYCTALPVQVKSKVSQPWTLCYLWAFRLAFEEFGLPKAIQVDKDSVFIDNATKSPFPSRVVLYLIGLGVELCFIKLPPPLKQSMVERSHQTLEKQVVAGQNYKTWGQLYINTNNRRKFLNEKYPCRTLGKKPPLKAFPKAKHSGRAYSIPQEEQLIEMRRVYKYLANCVWYRKVSSAKTVSLNTQTYYIKNALPKTHIQIKFCNRCKKLIFRDANELVLAKLPIKKFSKEKIMGSSTKQLMLMKKNLHRAKDFPLQS